MKLLKPILFFAFPIMLFGMAVGLVVLHDKLSPTPPEQHIASPEFMGWLVGREIELKTPIYSCESYMGMLSKDGVQLRVYTLPTDAIAYLNSLDFMNFTPNKPYSDAYTFTPWKRGSPDWRNAPPALDLEAVSLALDGTCEGSCPWSEPRKELVRLFEESTNFYASEVAQTKIEATIYLLDMNNEQFIILSYF